MKDIMLELNQLKIVILLTQIIENIFINFDLS